MASEVRSDGLEGAIARAKRHAPFLRKLIEQHDEVVTICARNDWPEDYAGFSELWPADSDEPAIAMRQERRRLALLVALGDLAGIYPFEKVVAFLSDFADAALDRAIRASFADRYPDAPVRGFSAIALGKHGSRELNYSSDIDLLFLFDPETIPHGEREDAQQAAVRLARTTSELLSQRTADGYVFRVDLRLRPSSEVTPMALPIGAAISHYETMAEAWERAVFIRGRAAAGDIALGEYFLEAISPFVWRRSLDFGAIREIQDMSSRIRTHHVQGQILRPGYDLKRGRGGIREIEFYAQIHQLIHGGREPVLRAPATLDALAALGQSGEIEAGEAERLGDAYRLLRTIEHRLQMVADQQTHSLPKGAEELDNAARLHGLSDGEALLELLGEPVRYVETVYDRLAAHGADTVPAETEALEARLREAGFDDPADARRRIDGWREGKTRTTRSAVAREALETVLPTLIEEFGRAPDPLGAINRFDVLLDRLPSAVNFFRLLEARPGLAQLLVDILSHAPALADELARHAELFDGLIDATALDPPEPLDELIALLSERSAARDYQERLDRMRQLVGEERFALGVQLIEGASDPLEVAAGYSRVAEAAIAILARAAIAEFEAVHGSVPDSELVILALGRLGGEALTHASDLDLVYLFTGDHGAESDGERSLGATAYYQRLGQRVTAALSVPTASGPLYEVDTRLRPSGGQGLLAVSFDSFETYHRDNAWTWEHMALARARPVYGSPAARARLEGMIRAVLERPREPAKLATDIAAMRAEIAAHKPPAGPLDVKLSEGGLVDLEFCVHFVQLRDRIGLDAHLPVAIGALVEAGALDPAMADAHDLLTRMLVTLRLVAPASRDVPDASKMLVAQRCGSEDWSALLADYEAARHVVRDQWRRLGGAGQD